MAKAKGIVAQWKEVMARRTDCELRNVYEAVDEVETICEKIVQECEVAEILQDLSSYSTPRYQPTAFLRLTK